MRDGAATGCPPAEDLTALAHGEGRGLARTALLRHVLSCPACRLEHQASQQMLLALRGLGAAHASQAPAGSRPRRGPRAHWAWLPPAVAAAAVVLALLIPFESRQEVPSRPLPFERASADEPTPAAPHPQVMPTVEDVEVLLAAQQPDGRWAAERGLGGKAGDEAATALVLLALLHPGAEALRHAPVAGAVATGSRWLVGRAAGLRLSEGTSAADMRARAVVCAALLRAQSLAQDPALRAAARNLLTAVTEDAARSADPASRPWLDYALALGAEPGGPGAERKRGWPAAAPRPVASRADRRADLDPRTWRASSETPGAPESPLGWALAALRDEPPLRALAVSRAALSAATVSR